MQKKKQNKNSRGVKSEKNIKFESSSFRFVLIINLFFKLNKQITRCLRTHSLCYRTELYQSKNFTCFMC